MNENFWCFNILLIWNQMAYGLAPIQVHQKIVLRIKFSLIYHEMEFDFSEQLHLCIKSYTRAFLEVSPFIIIHIHVILECV